MSQQVINRRDSQQVINRRDSQFPLFKKGINPTFYPTLVTIYFQEFECIRAAENPDRICFSHRNDKQKRHFKKPAPVTFPINFHILLFDVIKVDLLQKSWVDYHKRFGQATIKLSHLPIYSPSTSMSKSSNIIKFPVVDVNDKSSNIIKFPVVDVNDKLISLGTISLRFEFTNWVSLDDPLKIEVAKESSSNPSQKSYKRSSKNSARSASSSSNSIYTSPKSDSEKIYDYYTHNLDQLIKQKNASNDSLTTVVNDDNPAQIIKRANSCNSLSYKKPPKTLTKGINNLLDLGYALIATGWKLNTLEFPGAFKLLGQHYRTNGHAKTSDYILDKNKLIRDSYFIKYMTICYGSLARRVCGYGSIIDIPMANKSVAIKHLQLASPDHMLEWNYQYLTQGLVATKPNFFIVYDQAIKSLVVCVRGTFSVADVLTDVAAEYTPFMGGSAHSGILNCALFIRDQFLVKIKAWIRQYKTNSLTITGHSLGAGVSALLLCLLRDDLVQEFGPSFQCTSVNFATVPVLCVKASKPFEGYIENYVNQHDIVPKLSYGAVMDLKALMSKAAALNKIKTMTKEERIQKLKEFERQLSIDNIHPRLVIPGQIYYLYRKERVKGGPRKPPYVVEKSNPEFFDHVHMRFDTFWYHMPWKYDNGMKRAIEDLSRL